MGLSRQLGRVLRLRAIWACTSCTLRQCWLGTSRTVRRGLRLGVLGRIPPKCEELLVGLRRGLRLGVLGRIPPKCEGLLVGLRLGVLGLVIPLLGLCRAGISPSGSAWLSARLSLASLLVPPQSTSASKSSRPGRSCGVATSFSSSSRPPLACGSKLLGEALLLAEGLLRTDFFPPCAARLLFSLLPHFAGLLEEHRDLVRELHNIHSGFVSDPGEIFVRDFHQLVCGLPQGMPFSQSPPGSSIGLGHLATEVLPRRYPETASRLLIGHLASNPLV